MASQIKWQAPEFEFRKKTSSWYWMTILVAILILAISIWQKNFLFAIFIIIAEVLLIVWGSREPKLIEFKLTSNNLAVGESKSYSYSEIESYALDEQPDKEWSYLVLQIKKKFGSKIKISFPSNSIQKMRAVLQEKLPNAPEVEFEENFWDSIEKIIGF